MALAPYDFAAGQRHYLGNWKGWVLKISTFLGPNGNLLPSLPFQAPKKSWFSGPTPSNCAHNVFAPYQNHNSPRKIINRFIDSHFHVVPYPSLSLSQAQRTLPFFACCVQKSKDVHVEIKYFITTAEELKIWWKKANKYSDSLNLPNCQ